jgi:hypothetical protein
MKTILIATVATVALSLGAAHAQNAPAAKPGSMQLSQSECTALWQQAGGGTAGLTEAQAKPYVQEFKSVNPDGDTSIDQTEWMAACNKGLVHSSSNSGASTGTSGSSTSPSKTTDPDMKSPSK